MRTGQTYWEQAAQVLQRKPPDRLWRLHSDAVDSLLLNRWLPQKPSGRLLKTDMYDESLGVGITLPARASAWTSVGMDIAVDMLNAARRVSGRYCLAATDIRALSFVDNSFDVLFSNSTLDHFNSKDEISTSLGECYRVLKPGGKFLLTLDNPLNPVIALRQVLPYKLLLKLHITNFYYGKTLLPGALKHYLRREGFKIQAIDWSLHCPRSLAILVSKLLERYASEKTQTAFLQVLDRFEKLSRLPTRLLTGYYTVVCCQK